MCGSYVVQHRYHKKNIVDQIEFSQKEKEFHQQQLISSMCVGFVEEKKKLHKVSHEIGSI